MGCYIDNSTEIREVVTDIKIREGKFEDLYITIKYGTKKKAEYIIYNDSEFTIEHIKKTIDEINNFDNLTINECSEKNYLLIMIDGKKSIKVTGKKI